MINQLLTTPKGVLRVFPGNETIDRFEEMANLLRPKSFTQLTDDELNRIDAWQDANRGFIDDDRNVPVENSYEGSWTV